jgi:acetyl esterase
LAFVGDSAGGNLALNIALDMAGSVDAPKALAVIYPMLDSTNPALASTDTSWRRTFLSAADVAGFYRAYAPDGASHPTLSPIARPGFSALPTTIVQAAEHDPLRPDAVRLAQRLVAAGVTVSFRPGRGLVHGFLGFAGASAAARCEGERLWQLLRDAVGG